MIRFRCASAIALLTFGCAVTVNAQTEKHFPTNDEINLVLTQTERAIQQYKPLIDQEETQMGKNVADAVATDRQLVKSLEVAVKGFRSRPQTFNGPLGFVFFEWLDDAVRNSLSCGSGAATQGAGLLPGNRDEATALLHLAQSCMDVSALIYTVSENAGSLYQKYVEAEEQLATQAADVAQKCTDILKKNGITPKK
jgi:hypothetical protein